MNQEEIQKAYNYAVYLLSLHLRTQGELTVKLRLKKYNAEVIDNVIRMLAENRYIDDQRYAEVYLDNLKKYKTFGFYGIKKKLMEKRLPSGVVESVLADGLSVEEETKIAKRFLQKHRSDDKNKNALRLRAKGFRSEVIAKMIF